MLLRYLTRALKLAGGVFLLKQFGHTTKISSTSSNGSMLSKRLPSRFREKPEFPDTKFILRGMLMMFFPTRFTVNSLIKNLFVPVPCDLVT